MKHAVILLLLGALLLGCIQQGGAPATTPSPTMQAATPTPTLGAIDEVGELDELDEIDEEMSDLEEELDDWLEEEGFDVSDEELDLFG